MQQGVDVKAGAESGRLWMTTPDAFQSPWTVMLILGPAERFNNKV